MGRLPFFPTRLQRCVFKPRPSCLCELQVPEAFEQSHATLRRFPGHTRHVLATRQSQPRSPAGTAFRTPNGDGCTMNLWHNGKQRSDDDQVAFLLDTIFVEQQSIYFFRFSTAAPEAKEAMALVFQRGLCAQDLPKRSLHQKSPSTQPSHLHVHGCTGTLCSPWASEVRCKSICPQIFHLP